MICLPDYLAVHPYFYGGSHLYEWEAWQAQAQAQASPQQLAALKWGELNYEGYLKERDQIIAAKAAYPAWFEPASEWEKIP